MSGSMEDTSSFGATPGGEVETDRPAKDAMTGRGAPAMPAIGAQAGEDMAHHMGAHRQALEKNTHPEKRPPAAAEDSEVEGSEHLDGMMGGMKDEDEE